MVKIVLCSFLTVLSGTIVLAQKPSEYTLEYLDKKKCKDCVLIKSEYEGRISQIGTRKSRTWHGYQVTYYDNGIPEEVFQLHQNISHGKYILYYENGFIKEKGTYKHALPHGKWIYYDSTGSIEKIIKYQNGNDISNPLKYYYYFTAGMPNFRDLDYMECSDSIRQKWRIKYYAIAGCVVSSYAQELQEKNNRQTEAKMLKLHGPDWENKMEAEIKSQCLK
jgi:antitoxin component YwqK of YwqJK toxin-antitoxin module